MGTSGAYGGTGGKPWRDVRDLFDDVASGGDDAGGDGGPEGGDDVADEEGSPPSGNLSAIASALAAALTADDLDLSAPPSVLPVGRLLPVRPRRGGGSGHDRRGSVTGRARSQRSRPRQVRRRQVRIVDCRSSYGS